jgi:hypothetical protein
MKESNLTTKNNQKQELKERKSKKKLKNKLRTLEFKDSRVVLNIKCHKQEKEVERSCWKM